MLKLGDDLLADLFKHRLAYLMGKGTVDYEAVAQIAKMEEVREDAERHKVPTNPKELPVSGGELMALGLEGPATARFSDSCSTRLWLSRS